MIEAVMIWNEPNNLAHWDFHLDPEWRTFSKLATVAGKAVRSEHASVTRVLGGIAPPDPNFIALMKGYGVLAEMEAVGAHCFPLAWSAVSLAEWPRVMDQVEAAAELPVWVTEVGISSRSGYLRRSHCIQWMRDVPILRDLPSVKRRIWADADIAAVDGATRQELVLRKVTSSLGHRAARLHWYSLFDLPRSTHPCLPFDGLDAACLEHHFHMGLLTVEGRPKRAFASFREFVPTLGICQWFNYDDPRLEAAVRVLRDLGVRHLRTGLSWADTDIPGWERWFDRQMKALEPFEVTLTLCFTPSSQGLRPHHASPPRDVHAFADFCAAMTRRYVR